LLRDFIRRFSKCCTELLSVAQSEIVHTFLEGMTCQDLVRELGRSSPVDSNELFNIATSFTFGEEAVGAIFDGRKAKRVDDAPEEGNKSKEPAKKQKWGKKGKKPPASRTRRNVAKTMMRLSWTTQPVRVLEAPSRPRCV
jgi:hypothetical protein